MRSRIVHFYFSRFQHIIRQFRHFVFRIGSYETDRSAICLRVAAKTRTTDRPAIYRLADKHAANHGVLPMRYIRNLFAKQTPTLLLWPICISMYLMLIITPLRTNTKTLSRPIPTCPVASVGTGWNETAGNYNFYARTPA